MFAIAGILLANKLNPGYTLLIQRIMLQRVWMSLWCIKQCVLCASEIQTRKIHQITVLPAACVMANDWYFYEKGQISFYTEQEYDGYVTHSL